MDRPNNIRRPAAALIVVIALALLSMACNPAAGWFVVTSTAKGTPVATFEGMTAAPNTPPSRPATAAPGVTAPASPVPAIPRVASVCAFAFAAGNRILCQTNGAAPIVVAQVESPVNQPLISPDGALVAFAMTLPDGTTPLYVAKADGSGARLLVAVGQLPASGPGMVVTPVVFAWRPESHTLYFETHRRDLSTKEQPDNAVNSDLWTVNADSGVVEQILPAQSAGRFSLSPDGRHAVVSAARALKLLDLESRAVVPLLDFAAIDNQTATGYLPRAAWNRDSQSFTVVVPSSNPFAADATASVYRFGLDGKSEALGSVRGSFLLSGLLDFTVSPDGKRLVYGTFDYAGDQTSALHLANIDGSDDRVIEKVERDAGLAGLAWSPDSAHYVYTVMPMDSARLAGLDGSAVNIAPGFAIKQAQWVDANSFYFYGFEAGASGYYLQRLGQAPQSAFGDVPEANWFDYRESQEQH